VPAVWRNVSGVNRTDESVYVCHEVQNAILEFRFSILKSSAFNTPNYSADTPGHAILQNYHYGITVEIEDYWVVGCDAE
jgi:hypothetical protein